MQIGLSVSWRSPGEPAEGAFEPKQGDDYSRWALSYGGSINPSLRAIDGAGGPVLTFQVEGRVCLIGLTIDAFVSVRALARKPRF